MKSIEIKDAHEHLDDFLLLVREYTDSILQADTQVAGTLSAQHINEELHDIESKYDYPYGRMYVAFVDGNPAACAALLRNNNEYCEIKRLYVRQQFRGLHLGRTLSEKVIEEARRIGYQFMRLDTFPFMSNAIQLYRSLGFDYISRYNDNPATNAVFMQKTLR